jgi:hypothetical protein
VTLGEDKSTVHADNGPKIMAALRNTVVSLLRRAGFSTIAARMRYNSTHPQAALQVLSLSFSERISPASPNIYACECTENNV